MSNRTSPKTTSESTIMRPEASPFPTPPWLQTLREQAARKLTPDLLGKIVDAQVKKAEEGDQSAAKFLLDYLGGLAQLKGAKFVQNVHHHHHYGSEGERDGPLAEAESPDGYSKPEVLKEAAERYRRGDTYKQIAADLRISEQTIRRACDVHNVPLRGRGGDWSKRRRGEAARSNDAPQDDSPLAERKERARPLALRLIQELSPAVANSETDLTSDLAATPEDLADAIDWLRDQGVVILDKRVEYEGLKEPGWQLGPGQSPRIKKLLAAPTPTPTAATTTTTPAPEADAANVADVAA